MLEFEILQELELNTETLEIIKIINIQLKMVKLSI